MYGRLSFNDDRLAQEVPSTLMSSLYFCSGGMAASLFLGCLEKERNFKHNPRGTRFFVLTQQDVLALQLLQNRSVDQLVCFVTTEGGPIGPRCLVVKTKILVYTTWITLKIPPLVRSDVVVNLYSISSCLHVITNYVLTESCSGFCCE